MFRFAKQFVLILTAFALPPLDVASGESELLISRDFRKVKIHNMPCPASYAGLSFEKKAYPKQNAFEWQVRLQTPAGVESPLYEELKSADFELRFPAARLITVHWNKGSHSEATDFQPQLKTLTTGEPLSLQSFGGRSSDGVMPYFNVSTENGGLIVAVGWTGDWKASFTLQPSGKVRIVAGLKRSRFKLGAKEQVHLPSVLVMSYRGSWIDGQNKFRRLMLEQFTPRGHAPMDLMPVAASVHGQLGFNVTTEQNLIRLAADIGRLKLPLNTFWLDAGWNEGGFPLGQGNPDSAPARFPNGLAPVGKAVQQQGMRFLAWFEPERAMRGTWLDREHSDWLLTPSNTPSELRYLESDGFRLLDLGNRDARRWAVDRISQQVREAGVSIYRQDFNLYPSYFWQTDEQPDEVGLREIRYVNGLYDFLDELARRHPELILDNCAAGGRRLDFEMMRRCVVLWRSDNCWDDASFPRNLQSMTHGLSHWLPLHGLGAHTTDDVALRSGMGACASFPVNFAIPDAVAALREHLERYLKVRSLFTADFYPLTAWSDDSSKWLAFQFHDSEKGEGIVQAFCGPAAMQRRFSLKLQGLDANKHYTVSDWDSPMTPMRLSGAELLRGEIKLRARDANQAVVLHYKSIP